jgi:hypothetical protein
MRGRALALSYSLRLRCEAQRQLGFRQQPLGSVHMATIEFNAYEIVEVQEIAGVQFISISLHLDGKRPFPSERIEATKVSEVEAAFAAYVEKAKASGLRIQVSARVAKGRSPRGFDATFKRRHENLNI